MNRTAWQVLAASTVSFALAALLPASPLGGVRGMLVVLPVVAALFASVGRAAAGNRPSTLELALWAGWAVLALQHFALGLPGSSAIVAGVGLALAGGRALTLAVRLRRRIALPGLWPFFALPLALYLFAWPWTTTARAPDGDEPYYLLLTHSLAEDGDVDLADDYRDQAWRSFTTVPVAPQPGDPTGPRGEIYSRHSALLPLALAPLYLLAGPFGAQLGMLALAAAAAAAGLAAARARFANRPRGLLAAWMLLAFTPPLLLYAGQFWVEVPAALLLALVLRALARLHPADQAGAMESANRSELLALALPLVALPLLKLRFLALALPLGALAVTRLRGSGRHRRHRRELLLLVTAMLFALGLWNFARYGNPLRMYGGSDLAIFAVPLADHLRGDLGLFFDVAFGLFALAPIWLLLLPALVAALAGHPPGEPRRLPAPPTSLDPTAPIAELGALVPYILLIGMRREWYGGWSPPFRYGVVLLPAFALLMPMLFGTRRPARGLRALCAALAALTSAIALLYLVHPAWAYSLANGSSRLLDELSHELPVDLVRLLPSMVRPRPATWLVPLVLALAVAAPLLSRRSGDGGRQLRDAQRRRRVVWPLAALFLLLAWSGLLLAAARLPTARIEFEDAWVSHRGGALYPERWTVDRSRFDGGWALRRNAEVTAQPVVGGGVCRLAIRLLSAVHPQAPLALELRAGERLVATLPIPPADERAGSRALGWVTLEVDPFPLATGEGLSFRAVGPPNPGLGSFVVLDRAEVSWR